MACPRSMRMPMVSIAYMRVSMGDWGMLVFMGMPEGLIGVDAVELLRAVLVLVMQIACYWVMAMAMAMAQRMMVMPVAVLFPQQ